MEGMMKRYLVTSQGDMMEHEGGRWCLIEDAEKLSTEVKRLKRDIIEPLRDEMKSIALALGRSKTDGESDCDWHDLAGDVERLTAQIKTLHENRYEPDKLLCLLERYAEAVRP